MISFDTFLYDIIGKKTEYNIYKFYRCACRCVISDSIVTIEIKHFIKIANSTFFRRRVPSSREGISVTLYFIGFKRVLYPFFALGNGCKKGKFSVRKKWFESIVATQSKITHPYNFYNVMLCFLVYLFV